MARTVSEIHAYVSDVGAARAEIASIVERENRRRITFVDAKQLATCLPDVDVLVCGHVPTHVDWACATKLRLVHFLGAGVDGFFPAAGLPSSVAITNSRGIHATEMRDHALAMILAFERDLLGWLTRQRARRWDRPPVGSVAGKTISILGLGEVGRPIARACSALGMHVIGVCSDRKKERPIVEGVSLVLGPDDLHRALEEADYVVIALPLTPRTRGLLDANAIAKLRAHAVLVAISRGGIIDEDALVQALSSNHLRGAALDVFTHEPLDPSSPLWGLPNVIVTPHIAGWMPGYLHRGLVVLEENLRRLEAEEPLLTPVDREREY